MADAVVVIKPMVARDLGLSSSTEVGIQRSKNPSNYCRPSTLVSLHRTKLSKPCRGGRRLMNPHPDFQDRNLKNLTAAKQKATHPPLNLRCVDACWRWKKDGGEHMPNRPFRERLRQAYACHGWRIDEDDRRLPGGSPREEAVVGFREKTLPSIAAYRSG